MSTFTVETTVGQIVAERPGLSRVFENLGIDFCCGGNESLAKACQAKELDPETVVKVLEAAATSAGSQGEVNCSAMTLTELADHIEQTHHAYLREELPRLDGMVRKVNEVHGSNHPEYGDLEQTFGGMQAELTQHMMKEEQILFPLIRELDKADTLPSFHCGSVRNPIAVMEQEHDSAGQALARMNELTKGYQPPEDACNTLRAMLDGLKELEADLHQHIHKENNILFPRAVDAEKKLAGTV